MLSLLTLRHKHDRSIVRSVRSFDSVLRARPIFRQLFIDLIALLFCVVYVGPVQFRA